MTWFDVAVTALTDDSRVGCDAGHTDHIQRLVSIDNGTAVTSMICFDGNEYSGTAGYCPGDDDVSRTLALYGVWEPAETTIFRQAISATDGIVIDFGTQIGWYTLLALASGKEVLAVECVAEHEGLTRMNAGRYGFAHELHQAHCWVGPDTHALPILGAPFVAIAKVDLEGNDRWAIEVMHDLINEGLVRNILLEVSPCFNDGYPALLRHLMSFGYKAAVVNPWRKFSVYEIDEVVALEPQVDVILALEPWWS